MLHFFDVPLHVGMKSPNAMFYGGREHTKLDKALKNSSPGEIAYIWQIEWYQINMIKFKRMQTNFFSSNVFTTIVIIIAKAPHNNIETRYYYVSFLINFCGN